MPRNNAPAASTLRNRNRITNKTRLKIHQGSLDADAVLIPDEDEEKHRLTNLVAGVDAEDANVSATLSPTCHVTNQLWLCVPRMSLSAADKSSLTRNITFNKSCLRHIAQALLLDCRTESCSRRLQHLSQHQTRPGLFQITMSCIPPVDGKTQLLTFAHRRLWRRALLMELPVDLRTTWTRETRNGSTRTMRRLVEKAQALKVRCQPLEHGPLFVVQRRRGKSPNLFFPLLSPKTSLNS